MCSQPSSSGNDPVGREAEDAAARELMGRIQGGDERAFSEFYRRYAPALFAMVYEILGDQRESEDALQEAFVQMWKRASTYDPVRSNVFTWAVMISRHKAIDRLRSRQRRSHASTVIADEFGAADQADFVSGREVTAQGEERIRARAALEKLPEDQRAALHLAFFSGLTHAEIAEQLTAPLGTIKARIRRGLLALRELLEKP